MVAMMKKQDDEGSLQEKNNLKLFVFIFLLLSVICFFLKESTFEVGWKNTSDFFEMLSGAFLTTGIFSILLTFTDFMNYVSRHLRQIVVEHSYLRALSKEQKLSFKKRIDEGIFGTNAINDPESLYSFIDEKTSKLIKSSYRREFHDLYYYRNSESPDYWEVDNHTTYIFYKNEMDTNNLSVGCTSKYIVPSGDKKLSEIIKKLKICIDDTTFELKPVEISSGEESGIEDMMLVPSNKHIFKDNVPISAEYIDHGHDKAVKIKYDIKLSSELFKNKNSVSIEIERQHLAHKAETVLYLSMSYPTKDMLLTCNFEDGSHRMTCAAFGFDPKFHKMRSEANSAFVDIKEWILTGHGAAISWAPIEPIDSQD
jgi:hypothetical protein